MSDNRDDRFRESINNIEPAAGAKERMLENIRRKAAEQPTETQQEIQQKTHQKAKIVSFNKILKWAMPIAACFVIAVVGVTYMLPLFNQQTPSESGEQIPNPFVTVNSASDIEDALGFSVDAPQEAENVEYSILDGKMADIYFSIDDHAYSLRASAQSGDFSGLYGIEAKIEQLDSEKNAVLTVIRSGDDLFTKITWTDGKVNYVLSNTDGASESEVKAVFDDIR